MLALVKRWRPRAVLLDISLPAIALTGYDERRGPVQPEDRGFDAHLVKPTTLARIVEALGATSA